MRVFLTTTGCRLNQSEIETLGRSFEAAGHQLADDASQADLVVVNTCAVTREAARTSRALIRRAHRDNADAQIVATGCYAHLSPETVGDLPGVAHVVNNLEKDHLVNLVDSCESSSNVFDREPLQRDILPGALGRTRAFVKVQDGCDNRCTFCVTTIARGAGRSRAVSDVVTEIQQLAAEGYQEAVLTGVHLGSYGHDRGERNGLADLVRAVLAGTDIARLRLSSLEPWDLSPGFFDLWDDPRLCPHLHLPLQSGCDATLKRMARRTSQAAFSTLVAEARARIPGLAISTDVIVGFPGETDEEFQQSYDFIAHLGFMKLHVFRYSPRPGTAAASMPNHVLPEVKKARSAQMMALSDVGARQAIEHVVGRVVPVLWEQVAGATASGFRHEGYTGNYLRVEVISPEELTNRVVPVRVTGVAAGRGGLVAKGALVEKAPTQGGRS